MVKKEVKISYSPRNTCVSSYYLYSTLKTVK